ncbi:hypothetical protein SB2_10665, partial [Methylobacterium radiotolerans]
MSIQRRPSQPATVSASLFRGEGGASALLQLAADPAAAAAGPDPEAPTAAVIQAMPEGLAVTDSARRVLMANAALPPPAHHPTLGQAPGGTPDPRPAH